MRAGCARWRTGCPRSIGLTLICVYLDSSAVHNSSVNLAQNDIQGPDDRHDVRDQMPDAHLLQRLQVYEARRAHAHAPGLLRAVGNEIAANLAFRSFN